MRQTYSVALDGPSAAGKSSVAKAVAKKYQFRYVDTGAIYRTVALAVTRAGLHPEDADAVAALLPHVHLEIIYDADGTQRMLLDGADVSELIRSPEISETASKVSAQNAVRAFLLETQRALAGTQDVVMDGRDIGTVVLPDADVKIFLTASDAARAKRRWLELRERGSEVPLEEVRTQLVARDLRDETRAAAPLRAAADAAVVDTSELDFAGSVAAVSAIIEERLSLCPA